MTRFLLVAIAALSLAACRQDAAADIPAPAKLTADALGHYCQMLVADHAGPKSQIFLKGVKTPLWFGQVSDAIAYLHNPERDGEIVAFYVTDTARAESWAVPGEKAWTDGNKAVYVLDSNRKGGMGMPEAVPFASRADAEAFLKDAGGRIAALSEVPEGYVRPEIGNGAAMPGMQDMPGMSAMPAGAAAGAMNAKETN
ncbi:nitrous oxide reductase accessory protein NosL [Solirhodobacter olei]|uniref:nitrous oxide reductase accessory protein NosL n=1 Tax=Solirhodobacter olei TaxID=2493082 RepID=UPI000FD7CCAD|nr:nitrous oxide reductase accessory protein NosL [Solirhodobacter olei]